MTFSLSEFSDWTVSNAWDWQEEWQLISDTNIISWSSVKLTDVMKSRKCWIIRKRISQWFLIINDVQTLIFFEMLNMKLSSIMQTDHWYNLYLSLIFLKLISCEVSFFCKLNIEILYLRWENQNLDSKIIMSATSHNYKNIVIMTEFKNKSSWLRRQNVSKTWCIHLSDYYWEAEDSRKSQWSEDHNISDFLQ